MNTQHIGIMEIARRIHSFSTRKSFYTLKLFQIQLLNVFECMDVKGYNASHTKLQWANNFFALSALWVLSLYWYSSPLFNFFYNLFTYLFTIIITNIQHICKCTNVLYNRYFYIVVKYCTYFSVEKMCPDWGFVCMAIEFLTHSWMRVSMINAAQIIE